MSNEPNDLTGFEQRLAAVPPSPGQLERDRLLFAAGRAAGRRSALAGASGLCAALALLSTGLGALLVFRPPAVVEVERVVVVHEPLPELQPAPAAPSASESSPLVAATPPPEWLEGVRQRERVLRDGVDTTPSITWAAPPAAGSKDVPDLAALRLRASSSGEELP